MPDAPEPRYDSRGNLVAEWAVTLRYDPRRDELVVYWVQGEGTYHTSGRGSEVLDHADLEDAIRAVQTRARILGARRLL